MHPPAPLHANDRDLLAGFMREHGFATLLTCAGGTLTASHVPLLVRHHGAGLVLCGYMARTGAQARTLHGRAALAVFRGPHAYVPAAAHETPVGVPDWSYAAVHAHGRAAVLEDRATARALLQRFVEERDPAYLDEWRRLADATGDALTEHVLAFEVHVTRLDGHFALGQSRPSTERLRIAAALARGDPDARAVAALMRASLRHRLVDLRTDARAEPNTSGDDACSGP